jgi:hypothetical protein
MLSQFDLHLDRQPHSFLHSLGLSLALKRQNSTADRIATAHLLREVLNPPLYRIHHVGFQLERKDDCCRLDFADSKVGRDDLGPVSQSTLASGGLGLSAKALQR